MEHQILTGIKYINATALIDTIKLLKRSYCSDNLSKYYAACDFAIEQLTNALPADVVVEKLGEWIDTGLSHEDFYTHAKDKVFKCSQCEYKTTAPSSYCPACGAKMFF